MTDKDFPWSRRRIVLFVLGLSAIAAAVFWLGSGFTATIPAPVLALIAVAIAAISCLFIFRLRGGECTPKMGLAEQVIRQAEEGILTISPRGLVQSLNPAAEKLFGYRMSEVVNQPITMLMSESPSQDRPNLLRETLPAGSILGLAAGAREVLGKRKNGDTFPLELTGSSMVLGDDAFSVAFVRDVSKRKRAQRYLLAHYAATCILAEAGSLTEALPRILHSVCEALQWDFGAYWSVDSDAGVARCSDVYQSPIAALPQMQDKPATCKRGEGLPGRVLSTGQPGWVEDVRSAEERLFQTLAGAQQLRGAFGFPILLDQEIIGVLTFYCCSRQKREEQLLDIMVELGKQLGHFIARKRQEALLRETTQTLQALIQAAPVAIHITDLEGKVRLWNPTAERIFGWTEAEVLGRPLPSLSEGLSSERRTATQESDCLTPQGLQDRCQKKDGGMLEIGLWTAPLLDTTGKVVGALGIRMDLTEQKSLENQLRQAQKMEAVGQLAGGVAHDFNNLLTIISGYCSVLLEDQKPEAPAWGHLQEIHKAGERAAGLTRQLLAFSRKQIIQPRVLDLNDSVADVQKMLGRLIGEDIHLFTSLSPELGHVKADPGQIEQILVNLAVNARDAMPTGGKLFVETNEVAVDKWNATAYPELRPGQYARVTVRDTGCGMNVETLSRVFEPFFTTKALGKGTGLGLATVYGIVKQSEGNVSVSSEVGKGTTFEILLPIVRTETAESIDVQHDLPAPGGKETVLLAEDENAVRSLTRQVLQSKGYTVLEANNGEDACRVMEEHREAVDLLLTDVVMPHVGGRALSEAVLSRYPNAKVLFMSGYTDDAVIRNGVLTSENAFIQKPFSLDNLLHKVRDVLDRKQGSMLIPEVVA